MYNQITCEAVELLFVFLYIILLAPFFSYQRRIVKSEVYSTIFVPYAFIVENNIGDLVLQLPFIRQHFNELIRFIGVLTIFSY